ncbi:MAG: hypothetical protein HQK51_12715 [Oligoflexia bacterium]|nr:hypothetical protein [Oligoflexia bacterium]
MGDKYEFRISRFIMVLVALFFLFVIFRSCSTSRNYDHKQNAYVDSSEQQTPSSPPSHMPAERVVHQGGGFWNGVKDVITGVMIGHIFSGRSRGNDYYDRYNNNYHPNNNNNKNYNNNYDRGRSSSMRRGSFGGTGRSGGFRFGK